MVQKQKSSHGNPIHNKGYSKIYIDNGIEAQDYDSQLAPKIHNQSTRAKIPEKIKFQDKVNSRFLTRNSVKYCIL